MKERNYTIFYLKRKVIFPYCTINVIVGATDLSRRLKKGDKVLAYPIRSLFDIIFYKNKLATLAEITDINKYENSFRLKLKGLARTRLINIDKNHLAESEPIGRNNDAAGRLLADRLRKKSQELIFIINVDDSDKLIGLLNYLVDLNQLTDFISNYFVMDFKERYKLYRESDVLKRSTALISILDKLIYEMKSKQKEIIQ